MNSFLKSRACVFVFETIIALDAFYIFRAIFSDSFYGEPRDWLVVVLASISGACIMVHWARDRKFERYPVELLGGTLLCLFWICNLYCAFVYHGILLHPFGYWNYSARHPALF